jgi:HPt (histidine-containing phosphotransfer) domain-containing protein
MDNLDKQAQMLRKLTAIRESFLHRTRGELPLLLDLIGRIRAGDFTAIPQLQILAHRIYGSGATFDFSAISENAGQIENLLEALADTPSAVAVDPHDLGRLVECGRRLASEIGAALI